MKKNIIKKINNKGFAVSIILYISASIVVLVLFLVLSILSTNSKNKSNIVDNIKEEVSGTTSDETLDALGKVTIKASDDIASGSWHKDNFSLIVSRPTEEGVVIDYPIVYYYGFSRSGVNIKANDNQINVTESTSSTIYYIKACRSGTTNVCSPINSYEVKLDKDIPSVNAIGGSTDWVTSRKFLLESDARSGVAYYEYYISDWDDYPSLNDNSDEIYRVTDNNATVDMTGKFIFFRATNNVGRKGNWQLFNLYVDNNKPETPTIIASDSKISGEWHDKAVKLSLSSSYSPSGLDFYYSLTSKKPSEITTLATFDSNAYENYINFQQATLDTDVAVKACNKAGLCSDVKIYRMRIDTKIPTAPTVTGGNATWSTDGKTFEITSNAGSISGVAYYEYYISPVSTTPSATVEVTSRFTNKSITISTPGKYIYFREVSNSGNKSAWTTYKNLFINAANISNPIIIAGDGKVSGEWHQTNVTLNITSSLTTVPLTYYYGTNENTFISLGTNNKITHSTNTAETKYYFKVCQANDTSICSGIINYTVRLDKTPPTINVANSTGASLTTWTNTKTLAITPTATSGILRYDYIISNTTPNDNTEGIKSFTGNKITINDTGKLVFIKPINNLGVSGNWTQVNLYVDSSVPSSPIITANDNIESGKWHLNNTTLYASGSSALSGIAYYYSTTSNNPNDGTYTKMSVNSSGRYYITNSNNTDGITYYIAACNNANTMTCSTPTEYLLKIDKSTLAAPKIESGGNTTWTTDFQPFVLSTTNATFSGFSHYEYLTTSISAATSIPTTTVATGSFTGNEIVITDPGQYIYFREVNVAGRKSAWVRGSLYIDVKIPAPIITANDKKLSGEWHTANTTLTFSNRLTSIALTYYYGTTIEDVNNFKTAGVSVARTANIESLTYYVKACRSDSNKQNCSDISSYEIKLDKNAPTITIAGASATWASSRTLTITPTATSGIKNYEYYLSNSTTAPAANITDGVVKFDTNPITITGSSTYIFIRAINNLGVIGTWTRANLYVDSKVPEKPIITASDNIESGQWHAKAINLTFTGSSSLSGITYHFYRTDDETDRVGSSIAYNTHGLNVNTAGRTYYVKACNKSGKCSDEAEYLYKLDTSTPAAPTIAENYGTEWDSSKKQFTITPPESVSGIDHYEYYLSTSTTKPAVTVQVSGIFNNTVVDITEPGKYIYFRAVNKIGTVGNWTNYQNLYIDNNSIIPPTITAGDKIKSGKWHSAATNLTFTGSSSVSNQVTYYYGTDKDNLTNTGTSLAATSDLLKNNTTGITIYVKACNAAGVCSVASEYVYKLDNLKLTVPTIEGGSDIWTKNTTGRNFKINSTTPTVPVSGIKGYEYYISKTKTTLAATTVATGIITENTFNFKEPGQYIYFREVSNAGTKSSWTAAQNLYVEYEKYPLVNITTSDGILSNVWHTNATATINLTFNANIDTIPVTYYYYTNEDAVDKTGNVSFASTIKTLDRTYYVKVCRTDSNKQVCSDISSYHMLLDRNNPTFSVSGPSTTWTTEKKLTLTSTSFSGIDSYDYYLTSSTTAPNDTDEGIIHKEYSDKEVNELTISAASATYIYIKPTDKAGKMGTWTRYNLYVDSFVPNAPTITANDKIESGKWHIAKTTLTFTTDNAPLSGVEYKYYTSLNSNLITASSVTIDTNTTGTIYYVKACSKAGLCSNETSYILKVDKTTVNAPTVTANSKEWTADAKTFTIKPPTGLKIGGYEYYISNSSTVPSYTQQATGYFTENVKTISNSGTYIFFRVVLESGRAGNWSTVNNLYINTAFLSNLTIDNYNLSPKFSPNTMNYSITVPYDITKLSINATSSNASALNITGNENFVVGENKIHIETFSDDSTATYVINVTREEDKTNTLSKLSVGDYTLNPKFNPNINDYTVTVNNLSSITISAVPTKDTITITGTGEFTLASGENIFSVTAISASGDINIYVIKIINNK